MKNLPLIDTIEEIVYGRLSPAVARFMVDALATDPIDGAICTSMETLEKLKNQNLAQTVKGNLLGDLCNRWGTVHFHRGESWNIRTRISQKDGLEFTLAVFLPSGSKINRHRYFPTSFDIKRSQCNLGPFLTRYKSGIAVNALFTTHKVYNFLMQTFFHNSGKTVSIIHESYSSKNPFRYLYALEAYYPAIINGKGELYQPKTLPVSSSELPNTPEQPVFKFENRSKACFLAVPPKSKWEFTVTNDYPKSKKSLPLCRKASMICVKNEETHLVMDVTAPHMSSQKRGPVLSFDNCGSWLR